MGFLGRYIRLGMASLLFVLCCISNFSIHIETRTGSLVDCDS